MPTPEEAVDKTAIEQTQPTDSPVDTTREELHADTASAAKETALTPEEMAEKANEAGEQFLKILEDLYAKTFDLDEPRSFPQGITRKSLGVQTDRDNESIVVSTSIPGQEGSSRQFILPREFKKDLEFTIKTDDLSAIVFLKRDPFGIGGDNLSCQTVHIHFQLPKGEAIFNFIGGKNPQCSVVNPLGLDANPEMKTHLESKINDVLKKWQQIVRDFNTAMENVESDRVSDNKTILDHSLESL